MSNSTYLNVLFFIFMHQVNYPLDMHCLHSAQAICLLKKIMSGLVDFFTRTTSNRQYSNEMSGFPMGLVMLIFGINF